MAAAAGGAAINYAPNNANRIDTAALVIGEKSVITHIVRNDGTTPPSFARYGYAQEQYPSLESSSTLSNQVIIEPGLGSIRGPNRTVFDFNTISNESIGLFSFNVGAGEFPEGPNILHPTGVPGVKIFLDPRSAEGPPAWFIEVDSSWYSASTVIGTQRFKLTFELLGEINSVVTTGKAVESGAKVHRYNILSKNQPVVLNENPLFPPSKPVRQIG